MAPQMEVSKMGKGGPAVSPIVAGIVILVVIIAAVLYFVRASGPVANKEINDTIQAGVAKGGGAPPPIAGGAAGNAATPGGGK